MAHIETIIAYDDQKVYELSPTDFSVIRCATLPSTNITGIIVSYAKEEKTKKSIWAIMQKIFVIIEIIEKLAGL